MADREGAGTVGDDEPRPAVPAPAGFDPERDLPPDGARTESWRFDQRNLFWQSEDGSEVVVRPFTKAGLWLGRHYADGTNAASASSLPALERKLLFP